MPKQSIIISDFLGGLAPSRYYGGQNQADPASYGWDVNISQEANILRRGYGLGSITNASLVRADIAWMKSTNRTTGAYCYIYSKDSTDVVNKLHKVTIQEGGTFHTVADASPWPHELPTYGAGSGMEFYDGQLYYASGRYLGAYNLSLTFNNSVYNFLGTESLGANIEHPMTQGNGFLYIGNSNFSLNTPSVARWDGVIMQENYLDIGKVEKIVTDIVYGGKSVYIALTGKVGSTANRAPCSLVVWDGISESWQDEFPFPEEDFVAMKFVNGALICWGKRGLYQFNGAGFDPIHSMEGGPSKPWAVDIHPEGQVYYQGIDYTRVSMFKYGTSDKRLPSIIQKPLDLNVDPQFEGASGMLWVNKDNLYLGGAQSGDSLRRFTSSSVEYNSGTWRTPMITFPSKSRIVALKIYTLPMPSGCIINVGWAKDNGTTEDSLFTFTGTGTETYKDYYPAGKVANQFQLIITHSAGTTPKIRRIEVEYEPEQN